MPSLGADTYLYNYLLQAANGVVEEEEADTYLPLGYEIELPDDEWQPTSEMYWLKCDKCGFERSKKTCPGATVYCELCGTPEVIP